MDLGLYRPDQAREVPGVSHGVPMWHMSENGPAQMMIPFPSGQGTDGEIDKWLAQTRAVARLHHGPMPPYTRRDGRGGQDYHRPMLRAEMRDEATSGRAPPSRSRTGHEHGSLAVGSSPSSIQSLREMVSTSASTAAGSTPSRTPTARGNQGSIYRPVPMKTATSEPQGAFTAAGRQIRPRQLDVYPVEKTDRSEPGSHVARSPAVGAADASHRGASGLMKGKKTGKAAKKVASAVGKVPAPTVRPAAEFADVSVFPRRKAGQTGIGNNRPPVVITREVLEQHFNMPLLSVCKKLGLCATVLKKVCRQLGVFKWPYKETKLIARRQGRVIAASAPIPADLRGINAAVASSSTAPRVSTAMTSAGKRKKATPNAPSSEEANGRSYGKNRGQAAKRQRLSSGRGAPSGADARAGTSCSTPPAAVVPRTRRKVPSLRHDAAVKSAGARAPRRSERTCDGRNQDADFDSATDATPVFQDSSASSHAGDELSVPGDGSLSDAAEDEPLPDDEDVDEDEAEAEEEVDDKAQLVVLDAVDGQGSHDDVAEAGAGAGDFEDSAVADLWQDGSLHVGDDEEIGDGMSREDTPPGLLDATGSDREHDMAERALGVGGQEFAGRGRSEGHRSQQAHAMYGLQSPRAGRFLHDAHYYASMEERRGYRSAGPFAGDGKVPLANRRGAGKLSVMDRGVAGPGHDNYGARASSMASDARDVPSARTSMYGVHSSSTAGAYMHCRMGPTMLQTCPPPSSLSHPKALMDSSLQAQALMGSGPRASTATNLLEDLMDQSPLGMDPSMGIGDFAPLHDNSLYCSSSSSSSTYDVN